VSLSALIVATALSGAFPQNAQASGPARMILFCYMRAADLNKKDPTHPDGLIGTGPARRFILEMPAPQKDVEDLLPADIKVDDPTNILLGRPIVQFGFKGASLASMTKGSDDDILAIAGALLPAGKIKLYVVRTEKTKPITYWLFGNCSMVPTDGSDAPFEEARKQPPSVEMK
jgi:hypothetical protein